jgi:hypothetical protein
MSKNILNHVVSGAPYSAVIGYETDRHSSSTHATVLFNPPFTPSPKFFEDNMSGLTEEYEHVVTTMATTVIALTAKTSRNSSEAAYEERIESLTRNVEIMVAQLNRYDYGIF